MTARVVDIGGIVDHDFLFIVVVCVRVFPVILVSLVSLEDSEEVRKLNAFTTNFMCTYRF